MSGIFVTGTDTNLGKTLTCAWLVRHWRACYWKPVQSGLAEGTDAAEVTRLAGAEASRILPSLYELTAPLSPHEAARQDGVTIDLARFTLPACDRSLVVEGAGGVLVPLNDTQVMADLMLKLGLPVLVAARSGLGTINHTLLSLEALRHRGIAVAGVVMNGPPNEANRRAIELHGKVRVIAQLPWLDRVTPDAIASLPPPPPLEELI